MSLKGMPKNTDVTPLIINLVELLRPHTYVEFGIKRGYTFEKVIPFVQRAVGVDVVDIPHSLSRVIAMDYHAEFYHMSTNDFIQKWKKPVDFLFIDADHDHHQVLQDFIGMFDNIRDYTGIVCLHDTYPTREELTDPGYCGSAWKAAKEIREDPFYNKRCEIVTIPGPWFGMSIIRKVKQGKHLEWMK